MLTLREIQKCAVYEATINSKALLISPAQWFNSTDGGEQWGKAAQLCAETWPRQAPAGFQGLKDATEPGPCREPMF